MKKLVIILIAISAVASCSPRIKQDVYTHSQRTTKIRIINIGEQLPENVKLIGTIKIGEKGFTTKCGYYEMLQVLESEGKKMGGDIVYITTHKKPDLWSTCHRFEANVYKMTEKGIWMDQ